MRCIIISANKEETKALAALAQFCIFERAGIRALALPGEAIGGKEAAIGNEYRERRGRLSRCLGDSGRGAGGAPTVSV